MARVFSGRKQKTGSGLTKDKLMRNKAGKVVSKSRSAHAKKQWLKNGLKAWADAVKRARKEQGGQGGVEEQVRAREEAVAEERLEGLGRCREAGAEGAGPHRLRGHRGQVRRWQGPVRQGQVPALMGSSMPRLPPALLCQGAVLFV